MRSILRLRWPAGAALLLLLIPVLLIVGATQGNSAEPLFLPVVSSCNFAPGSAPPSPQALIRVTPTGGIIASTYNANSFLITNQSADGSQIMSVRFDLSTSLLPDVVFDPNGGAGDNVAKDVTVDSDSGVGYDGRTFDQPRDGGFDIVLLEFGEFETGETFGFSVDIDPTSIKGGSSPGPNESGSVSGLEMSGATVTVKFMTPSGEAEYTTSLHPVAGSDSLGQAIVRSALPPAPHIEVLGLDTPTTTQDSTVLVQISGEPGALFTVWNMEAGLFTAGLPGGGFDLDPFEANSVVLIRPIEQETCWGTATIAMPLAKVLPEAGLNYLIAYQTDQAGLISPASNVEVVEFVP